MPACRCPAHSSGESSGEVSGSLLPIPVRSSQSLGRPSLQRCSGRLGISDSRFERVLALGEVPGSAADSGSSSWAPRARCRGSTPDAGSQRRADALARCRGAASDTGSQRRARLGRGAGVPPPIPVPARSPRARCRAATPIPVAARARLGRGAGVPPPIPVAARARLGRGAGVPPRFRSRHGARPPRWLPSYARWRGDIDGPDLPVPIAPQPWCSLDRRATPEGLGVSPLPTWQQISGRWASLHLSWNEVGERHQNRDQHRAEENRPQDAYDPDYRNRCETDASVCRGVQVHLHYLPLI